MQIPRPLRELVMTNNEVVVAGGRELVMTNKESYFVKCAGEGARATASCARTPQALLICAEVEDADLSY